MLVQFSVENFRSIKDEVVLSLVAGAGEEHRQRNVHTPTLRGDVPAMPLLRSAAIYGANAAGKTNLIRALDAMREIVVNPSAVDAKLPVKPFLFDAQCRDAPTQFEVVCIANGVRYQYGFSATQDMVVAEWLYAWPRGRRQLWFNRDRGADGSPSFTFGGKLQGDREVWRRATRSNALFLATAATLNSEQLRPLYDWFKRRLHVGFASWDPSYSSECVQGERKADVMRLLQAADLAVPELRVSEEEFTTEMLPDELSAPLREGIKKELDGKTITLFEVHVVHRDKDGTESDVVELDLDEESDGTRKMFALAGPWVDTLEAGLVVVVDELHQNLHPALVRFLVGCFHDPALDNNAQLVLTTHDTSILSQDVFRRDQVWFCERNSRHETALTPLSDYQPRKGVENLERAYLGGRYGAVPYIRST